MAGVSVEPKKTAEPYWVQPEEERQIAGRIWREFDRYRVNRNRIFSYFRERNCIEYWNDSDQRFNNYREKPDWKDEWQANISDITTHSKVMAIIAMVVANRLKPEFSPKYTRDFFAKFKAQLLQDLYQFTDTVFRNGDLDDLFTILLAARRGTVIGFDGWLKTNNYEGTDAQFVPLEDFYPQYVNKFRIEDQDRVVWRSVVFKDDADKVFKDNPKYINYDKVKSKGGERGMTPTDLTFFNVSDDIADDKVEILRWFSKEENEFHITVQGILITPKNSKLSAIRKDGELGFWKAVYEPYDYNFFYGRSLPDLMSDNQDAIDFLFNSMFDQNMLAVLKPIFTTGANQLTNGYLQPGKVYTVTDAQNIFQPKLDGPDQVSFAILQELQKRQNFISTDPLNQGISAGPKRTATEIEATTEASKRIMVLFTTLLQDALKLKVRLRTGTNLQFMLGKKDMKPIVLNSVKLFKGQEGTRIVEIVPKDKLATRNQFGFSKELALRNAMNEGELSEIIQITPEEIKNFEYTIDVKAPPSIEMSKALQRAFNRDFYQIGLARPDLFNQKEIARGMARDANQEVERMVLDEGEGEPSPTEMAMMGAGGSPGASPLARTPASPKPLEV